MRRTALFLLLFLGGVTILGADTSDSEKQIRKILEDQVRCWNKGDLIGFMEGYWNSEELSFYSGNNKQKGWKSTMDRYKKRYQAEGKEMGHLTFSEIEVQMLSMDYALLKGRWKLRMNKESPEGLFTLIVQKTKEGWKIVHDHTSS